MRKNGMRLLAAVCVLALAAGCASPQNPDAGTQAPGTSQGADQTEGQSTEQGTDLTVDPSENEGALYTPGDYTETAYGHNGNFEVTVTVSEDAIEEIRIGDNDESYFVGTHAMEQTRDRILAGQTVKVDTVSGATISSGALIRSVSSALEAAGADLSQLPEAYEAEQTYADETTQVVVVGSGSAGLAAAVEAHEQGLEVILVEQLGEIGGSSARAGYYVGGSTVVEAANNDPYSTEDFTGMLVTANPGQEELAQILGEAAGPAIDWLYGLGLTDIFYDAGSVYGSGLHWGDYGPVGGFMAYAMQDVLDQNQIDYRLNTKATSLIMEEGKVTGITVEPKNGNAYTIHADAVILATGGYAANGEMVAEYTPELTGYRYDCSMGADGSGMQMAEAAGAALDNMSDVFSYYGLNVLYNGVPRNLTYPYLSAGPIIVNEEGERFVNELMYYDQNTVLAMNEQTGRHGFVILTQSMADQLFTKALDYAADLEQMYTRCETLDEVAETFGIDGETLKNTVEQYNSYVESGTDPDFGRPDFAMPQKIEGSPLYVAEVTSAVHMTYGGIRTDNQMHALTAENEIIEGLYAAGECTHVMLNGIGTNTIALVEGRLAVASYLADSQ